IQELVNDKTKLSTLIALVVEPRSTAPEPTYVPGTTATSETASEPSKTFELPLLQRLPLSPQTPMEPLLL
ncbi:2732_t:CDS:2, partial [Cetraspora pellucida]